MTGHKLRLMATDDLWNLRERLNLILNERLTEERNRIDERLRQLGIAQGSMLDTAPKKKHRAKYQNPNNSLQTWSGRGKIPRWVAIALASGSQLSELRAVGRNQR